MLWVHTNVRIGVVHTCGHVSVFCSSFCSSIRFFCSSVCASMIVYHCARRFIFRPSICLIFRSSVRPSVCMFTCTYVETTVLVYVLLSSKIELTWLIPCLAWVFTGHSFHLLFLFFCCFFRVAVQTTTTLPVCAPIYAKTMFTIAKKVHIYLWAITLYYSTSRLWQWRRVNPRNPKPVITFYNCKIWYLKLCTKTYYNLTVGPPCLIEQELYVENADWILRTLSTRKCSSNDRLRP